MSKVLFSLAVFSFLITIIQGIACYYHTQECLITPWCLNDTTKKNCTGPDEQYCFKEVSLLELATRGCASLDFCNATALLRNRYCCDTDYCNHAMSGVHMNWSMMVVMVIISTVIIKG